MKATVCDERESLQDTADSAIGDWATDSKDEIRRLVLGNGGTSYCYNARLDGRVPISLSFSLQGLSHVRSGPF
jgi:hypothetical protein